MAHYALLNTKNIVINVICGKKELEDSIDWEEKYSAISKLVCKRTSYNTYGGIHLLGKEPFRKNYAGIGYTYDSQRDAFIPPKPYPSWILNEDTCLWYPPVPCPDDGKQYSWNEEKLEWQEGT